MVNHENITAEVTAPETVDVQTEKNTETKMFTEAQVQKMISDRLAREKSLKSNIADTDVASKLDSLMKEITELKNEKKTSELKSSIKEHYLSKGKADLFDKSLRLSEINLTSDTLETAIEKLDTLFTEFPEFTVVKSAQGTVAADNSSAQVSESDELMKEMRSLNRTPGFGRVPSQPKEVEGDLLSMIKNNGKTLK